MNENLGQTRSQSETDWGDPGTGNLKTPALLLCHTKSSGISRKIDGGNPSCLGGEDMKALPCPTPAKNYWSLLKLEEFVTYSSSDDMNSNQQGYGQFHPSKVGLNQNKTQATLPDWGSKLSSWWTPNMASWPQSVNGIEQWLIKKADPQLWEKEFSICFSLF